MKITNETQIKRLAGVGDKLTEIKRDSEGNQIGGGKPVRDTIVFADAPQGLAVRIAAHAAAGSLEGKTYLFQYTSKIDGHKRRERIGACSVVSFDDAKKKAIKLGGVVAHDRDPFAERQEKAREAAVKAYSLGMLIDDWAELGLARNKPRYRNEAPRTVRQVFRKHLSTPAAKLDRATVVQVHDALAKTSPVMAARAIAYASAAYGWAILRSSLAANPFEKIPTTAASKRERVLSDEELRAVWNATGGELAFDSIVRLLMLTGQRRGEVAGMTWNEISADGKTWTIPGVRTKNGAEHVVPLSRQAQAIIAAQPRRSATDLVFPARRGPFNGWPVAKDRLDHASGVSGWVLHDLRRTVATNLQRLGVRLEVTEAILNHVSGSRAGIVGVYQKHDWAVEKIRDLQAWADRLEAIVEGREAGNNVVELKTAAER